MKELTLKQAMDKLEKTVDELEKGELEIEQAVELYEEAMKLSVFCSQKISDSKQKIIQLKDEQAL